MQGELATTLAKLQVRKGALHTTFDDLEVHSSTVRVAECAGQEPMMSNLRKYISRLLVHVKKSTKAYKWIVIGDI